MSSGALSKLCILAYENKKKNKAVTGPKVFWMPINPETYSLNLAIEYEKKKGQGNQGAAPKYTGTKPRELKLDFILDGTGTVEGYHPSHAGKTVAEQLDHFLAVTYDMNGKIHAPNYLKVRWGKELTFDCVLTKVDVNYTLFDRKGIPLRGKVSASFLGHKEEVKRLRDQDMASPDLTHVFVLEAEETLTARAFDVYGSNAYYREVAAANDLTSFRNLPSGTSLVYPPIRKSVTNE